MEDMAIMVMDQDQDQDQDQVGLTVDMEEQEVMEEIVVDTAFPLVLLMLHTLQKEVPRALDEELAVEV